MNPRANFPGAPRGNDPFYRPRPPGHMPVPPLTPGGLPPDGPFSEFHTRIPHPQQDYKFNAPLQGPDTPQRFQRATPPMPWPPGPPPPPPMSSPMNHRNRHPHNVYGRELQPPDQHGYTPVPDHSIGDNPSQMWPPGRSDISFNSQAQYSHQTVANKPQSSETSEIMDAVGSMLHQLRTSSGPGSQEAVFGGSVETNDHNEHIPGQEQHKDEGDQQWVNAWLVSKGLNPKTHKTSVKRDRSNNTNLSVSIFYHLLRLCLLKQPYILLYHCKIHVEFLHY